MSNCPVCNHSESKFYYQDKLREFLICPVCDVVFVPPQFHLSLQEEKKRYDLHENNAEDSRYKEYFLEFIQNSMPYFTFAPFNGLDIGCGRSTLLADLLNEKGNSIQSYDPFFYADEKLLKKNYQSIWMSEVWEHLKQPQTLLEWVKSHLVKDGAWFMRTSLRPNKEIFSNNWYYKNDPTHVLFSSEQNMQWIANKYQFKIVKMDTKFLVIQHS